MIRYYLHNFLLFLILIIVIYLIFFFSQSGTILVVDLNVPPLDRYLSNGPFTKMSISPQGNMLACYTSKGSVFVTPPDFQGVCHTFSTDTPEAPLQMEWCGGDSVVCLWPKNGGKFHLCMFGPQNSYISFNYYEPLYLVPEIDGLRIVSQSECEMWQLVPSVTVEIFATGSTHPSAILFDANSFFEDENPQADEFIRRIKSDLSVAVKKCIEAAGYETSVLNQQRLLRVNFIFNLNNNNKKSVKVKTAYKICLQNTKCK